MATLRQLPTAHLECRDTGHRWDYKRDLVVRDDTDTVVGQIRYLCCTRCDTWKIQTLDAITMEQLTCRYWTAPDHRVTGRLTKAAIQQELDARRGGAPLSEADADAAPSG